MPIPVYLFAGFLESGKTSFIASVLQDPGFTQDEKTLLISCEQGLNEFEPQMLEKTHAAIEYLEDEDEWNEQTLRAFVRTHHPDRVLVEMNGMWDLDAALARMPKVLELYQVITTVCAKTYELYAANIGQRMIQHLSAADMIVFNRATDSTREMLRARNVRSMNPRAAIYFENEDGTSEEYGEGMPPPYDLDAPIVEIRDEWFGLFYIDASERPEVYDEKIVRFTAETYRGHGIRPDEFVPGRLAMVCCADDIRPIGFIAKMGKGQPIPPERSWNTITATIHIEERAEYRGGGPVLYVHEVTPTTPPEEEVVRFGT